MPTARTIDDSLTIRMILQRLCLAGQKVALACRGEQTTTPILVQEADRIFLAMSAEQHGKWAFTLDENVAMTFQDRGLGYEAVVEYAGFETREGQSCVLFSAPRSLRRNDEHRVIDFAPETAPKVTFTNSRNALLDGQISGLGRDGFEMSLRDPGQNIREVLRLGEESTLDVALEDDLRLTATARVDYYGENNVVGMKFTDKMDKTLLGQYRSWLDGQQRVQAQRDKDSYLAGGGRAPARTGSAPALPQVKVWVERTPAILVLTEREAFARHMGEALGRKFGVRSLDYITGSVKPFLGGDWGGIKLIVIHNQLRLVSPLELSRQLVEQEKCPVPVLLAGTDEDVELKRNRAMAAGAVDYVPVEPFKILSVLRKLDETLKLFEGI